MLEALISSRTRLKLLFRFFLNPHNSTYLRSLADEFDESTNAIRVELNRFEEAGMLLSESQGNKKMYRANDSHPLYKDLHNILLKYIGVDRIIENVIERLGHLERVYLTGDFANGKDSGIVDLIFVGNIDINYLMNLIAKSEKLIDRKIRFLIYQPTELIASVKSDPGKYLLLWESKS
ncbi:MAG TPA: hypothetical protein VN721_10485 [Flavipsychrobacter sp.]|nr:hypothetical protein [Flavipsychrobacter sp.]